MITQRFFEAFKIEHQKFLAFIKGIPSEEQREWYTSVMLSRLMLVHFMQKKGFLNGDEHYLPNHLESIRQQKGSDSFCSFYRTFLLRLFHDGLGKSERSAELEREFGCVPYLNGGLFEEHKLEQAYPDIQIPDEAFDGIFNFFSKWQWHLDERGKGNTNAINPDVLDSIFEKFANQRKTGTYYTKEDITEYIAKNTIISYLFNATKEEYPGPFQTSPTVWQLLQENPEKYIYTAMKKGVEKALPEEVAAGLQSATRRHNWNEPAADEYALPAETWREVVTRRKRYNEIRCKLVEGRVTSIDDFITYNLDICTFAQDVIKQSQDIELIRHFYAALSQVKLLDPTCGSGAFLLAALNILKPLYDGCLERMVEIVEKHDRLNGYGEYAFQSDTLMYFRELLHQVGEHPNRDFFVLKSIMMNNLYGVEIKPDVVEICKLRLFLKLLAQIDTVDDLEPLPDLDFNIYSGNSLVGFASYDELKRAILGDGQKKFDFHCVIERIENELQKADQMYRSFQALQVQAAITSAQKKQARVQLDEQFGAVNKELHAYLAGEYRIEGNGQAYQQWQQSHRPFHWFVEFHEIMKSGGFDVVIGNPPYLEIREVDYSPSHYQASESGAIHAICIERGLRLLRDRGCMSMIVPLALVSTQRMQIVQNLLEKRHTTWYSNYSWRPSKLFDSVNRALTIFVITRADNSRVFSTGYQKWTADNRDMLMAGIGYVEVSTQRKAFWVPKLGHEIELSILEKCVQLKFRLSNLLGASPYRVYYRTTGGLYWKVFTDFPPAFKVNGEEGHSTRETWFTLRDGQWVKPMIALLSSDFFWWWYTITTNCRDLNPSDIQTFPLPETALADPHLEELGARYLQDIQVNSATLIRNQKQTGRTETQSFKIQRSKPLIDQIDRVLAGHYGFADEELDFIINYDIKYRMGKDAEEQELVTLFDRATRKE